MTTGPCTSYGLPGTTMGRSLLRELREAWSTGHVRHAVAFLDFPAFFAPDPPARGEEDELRLRFLDDGSPNPDPRSQRLRDTFLSVFTLAALSDSVTTILSQRGGDRVLDLRADGTSTDADFANAARAEGMNAVFSQKDEFDLARIGGFQRLLADWHGPMPNMNLIEEMIRFCRAHDISLTLILASSHADALEIYRRGGLWPRVEQIKVDLADLVTKANDPSITAWDFVEYAPWTTETLPPPGDRTTPIRWFWEPVHFKRALGEVMLQRVFHGMPADIRREADRRDGGRAQPVRTRPTARVSWLASGVRDKPGIQMCSPAGPAAEASR